MCIVISYTYIYIYVNINIYIYMLNIIYYTLYIIDYTLYIVHYTLYIIHYILYIIYCISYIIYHILNIIYYIFCIHRASQAKQPIQIGLVVQPQRLWLSLRVTMENKSSRTCSLPLPSTALVYVPSNIIHKADKV